MSENAPSIEKLEKQLRVLQRKLERSEWHRVDLENQHDRDQHLYRRLQSDLEAARREAEIEAALERVRSRTMAMQSSDELPEAANLLFQQVQSLGMPAWSAGYCIWDEDRQGVTQWVSTEGKLLPSFHTPLTEVPAFIRMREAHEQGELFYVEEIGGDALAEHYRYMRGLPVVGDLITGLLDDGVPLPTFQIFHCAYFSHGFLLFITCEPVPTAHPIFQRFAKVFDQTYTRYLDLKQAEAQAREAEIEAALERVRSRTMGMQKSEELKDIIHVVRDHVVNLDIHADHAGFIMDYKDRDDMHIWLTDENEVPAEIVIPYFDSPHWNSFREAKARGIESFTNNLDFDEKNAFYNQLFELIPGVPEETKAFYLHCPGLSISTVLLDNVGLYIENFSARPYTDEENRTLLRFGKVFQQAYTRYLDLEQAEARAREAQIEASMERVRSRALAMNTSEELLDVVFKIRQEFAGLGLECGAFWHTRYTPEVYQKALTSLDGQKLAAVMELPRDFASNPDLAAWEHSAEPIGVFPFDAEAGTEYMHHMATKGKFSEIDPDAITAEMVREHGGITFVQARTSHGEIGYSLWGEAEPSDEAKDVLVRFANAFDLAYRRFLDLQQAEEAARYLQAENERKTKELEGARALQLSMLPKALPVHPRCELAASMQTATEVGGDYYDVDVDECGTLTLAIGDATGHGLQAGTMVTATKSLFLLHARESDLAAVLRRATQTLQRMGMRKLFMALALVRLRDEVLELAGAGMPPALVYRAATESVETVSLKGLPLGSALPFPYHTQRVRLEPGDTVVLMSDGFPELFNADGDMLGYERAAALLTEIGGTSAEEVIVRFEETARAWTGNHAPGDDITFVVLKARAPTSRPVRHSDEALV